MFCSDLKSAVKRVRFPVLLSLGDLRKVSLQRFTSVLFLYWLALGGVQFAAKVLWRCVQQPVGVHQTQVSHVAAGGVQQLVEDYVCWLALEKDGGGVDGHGLVGVQSQVAAVRLELRGVDEHPVGEAATNIPCVCPT